LGLADLRRSRDLATAWDASRYPAIRAREALAALVVDIPAEHGNCYGSGDLMFYGREYAGRRPSSQQVAEARALCVGCPIQAECKELGQDVPWGVWGGLTPGERGFRDGRKITHSGDPPRLIRQESAARR
jgi:hypothetical protein